MHQTLDLDMVPQVLSEIGERYGIAVTCEDSVQVNKLLEALRRLPAPLITACGIKDLGFKDLGVSKEYYPNHGLYVDSKLFLNTQNIDDPQVFQDPSGRLLDRFDHTLYHEMGHGIDEKLGNASMQDAWMSLSGWSPKPFPGGLKIIIREEGSPDLTDDWYYDSKAAFPRFYAKRTPYEDYADCFAFYVSGLKGFLPASKIHYFDEALADFYPA